MSQYHNSLVNGDEAKEVNTSKNDLSFEDTLKAFDTIIPRAKEVERQSIEDSKVERKAMEDRHYVGIMNTIQSAIQKKEAYHNGVFSISIKINHKYVSACDPRFKAISLKMKGYGYNMQISSVDGKHAIKVTND
jgi:hypothetical protein